MTSKSTSLGEGVDWWLTITLVLEMSLSEIKDFDYIPQKGCFGKRTNLLMFLKSSKF